MVRFYFVLLLGGLGGLTISAGGGGGGGSYLGGASPNHAQAIYSEHARKKLRIPVSSIWRSSGHAQFAWAAGGLLGILSSNANPKRRLSR